MIIHARVHFEYTEIRTPWLADGTVDALSLYMWDCYEMSSHAALMNSYGSYIVILSP